MLRTVVIGLALVGVAGCTVLDPLYCDERRPCTGLSACNLATRTCEPRGDAGELGSPRAVGESCSGDTECGSGHCVEKVCCATVCEGPCRSCALTGSRGSCVSLTAGQPCGADVCSNGALRLPRCDGNGACEAAIRSCGGYACDSGGACKQSCSSPADCLPPFECVSGSCTASLPLGSECGQNPKACASGSCVDGVCCDKSACPECQACNLAAKGSCSAVGAGKPCGDQKLTCDDKPQSSGVLQPRCDGAGSCVPTVVQTCTPHRCRIGTGGPACGTSCTTHPECTTLCDPFIVKSTCRPAAEVCFADVKVCPAKGAGTQASPSCKIRDCLDAMGSRTYVAVADGKYLENLSAKSSPLAIVSTGTAGPVWSGQAFQAKVLLQPSLPTTPGIEVGQGQVYLYGIDLRHPAPSSPPQPGDPSGLLVQLANAQLTIRTSHLHHGNALHCLEAFGSKLHLEDVVVDACVGSAIRTENTDAWLQDVAVYWSSAGLSFDAGSLFMRDVALRFNGDGLSTFKAKLDLDRVRVFENSGNGLILQNGTSGHVANLLVHGNLGKGIRFFLNPTPPAFVNVTITKNGGLELEGDSFDHGTTVVTRFSNSIIWDGGTAVQGPFEFLSSDVSAMLPFNSTSISKDPIFVGTAPEPYALHPSSPCVDRGDDATPGLPSLDLLKNQRQVDRAPGGPKVDLGALELQP